MLKLFLVGAGGFVGSICRYLAAGWVQGWAPFSSFPWGTLAVNVAGCFALGAAAGLAALKGVFSPETRLLLMVGFLGGFTTFSTFGLESFALLEAGSWLRLAGNLLASVLGGLGAVWLGQIAARLLA